ncbi:MAG: alpha/beta fold hydrolase, partial [Planctomycetota bacterium]
MAVVPADWPEGEEPLTAFVSEDPGDGERRPAVIFLHGGFAYGPADWEMAAPFRDAGFVTMTPILRGENGQPGVFTAFHREVRDVLAAASALASMPHVDPDRIYVAGHSAGAILGMLAAEYVGSAEAPPVRFAGVASLSGNADLSALKESSFISPVLSAEDESEWTIRSYGAFLESLSCPVLFVDGSEEGWKSEVTAAAAAVVQELGLESEFKVVPG